MNGEMWSKLQAMAGPHNLLDYENFVRAALFAPGCGYYSQPDRTRIGRTPKADFTTASQLQPVFGELVAAAAQALLKAQGEDAAAYTFAEIGNETPGGILAEVVHPFATVETFPLGKPVKLNGKCVVFSNELFDAQPFVRLQYHNNQWRELGLRLDSASQTLSPCTLPEIKPSVQALILNSLRTLDAQGYMLAEGHILDYSTGAESLLNQLTKQPWSGVFLALDYGKTLAEMLECCPEGTARAYRGHRQHNAIHEFPGNQDITHHVCWDGLEQGLASAGFTTVQRKRQEAFFVEQARERVGQLMKGNNGLSDHKRKLMALLHPAHFGGKFEAIYGYRPQ